MLAMAAKYKAYGVIALILTAAVLGFYKYVTHLNTELEETRERAAQTEYAYEVTHDTLLVYAGEISKRNTEIDKLKGIFKGANYEADEAMAVFRGDRLQKLLNERPDAIVARVNNATIGVFDDIREISRGDLTRGGETDITTP